MAINLSLIVAVYGMFFVYLRNRKRPFTGGNTLQAVFAFATIVLAVAKMVIAGTSHSWQLQRLIDDYNRETQLSMVLLGEYLAKTFPGEKLLIIAEHPSTRSSERHELSLVGLREGLGSGYPAFKVATPEKANDVYDARVFDSILGVHEDRTLVLSLMGLPEEFSATRFWKADAASRPSLVAAFCEVDTLRRAIADGKISAVFIRFPGRNAGLSQQLLDGDIGAVIATNYMIISEFNVHDVDDEYPGLFVDTSGAE